MILDAALLLIYPPTWSSAAMQLCFNRKLFLLAARSHWHRLPIDCISR